MPELVSTRRSLHAVAELLLAGPQHATSGTIKLAPTLNGFGCTAAPGARVQGGDLLLDGRAARLDGRTIADLGRELGLEPHSLAHVYSDSVELTVEEVLSVDDEAADEIARAFAVGDVALKAFAAEATPVLWPEHFDLGITVDDVNYGVSPGDRAMPEPYLYVGPHEGPPSDDGYWNTPFGAATPAGRTSTQDDAVAFFSEGRQRVLIDRSRT